MKSNSTNISPEKTNNGLTDIRAKIKFGYYNLPKVKLQVIDKLLKDLN